MSIATALNPRTGNSLLERYGPIATVVAWLGVTTVITLGIVPEHEVGVVAYGALSAAAGAYIKHEAS